MTTPLIPILKVLVETTYTPYQLEIDKAFEAWLTDTNYPKRLKFVSALMTAYRKGDVKVTYTFDELEDATRVKEAIEAGTDYNYEVTRTSPTSKTITVRWAPDPAIPSPAI